MTRKQQAFTLIELMIYLASTSILCLLLFSMSSVINQTIVQKRSEMKRTLAGLLVRDAIRRDLLSAGSNSHDFIQNQAIFKVYQLDIKGNATESWIGWDATERGMRRSKGIYDPEEKHWIKRYVSYLPAKFTQVWLDVEQLNGQVHEVKLKFQLGQKIQEESIRIRSRVLA